MHRKKILVVVGGVVLLLFLHFLWEMIFVGWGSCPQPSALGFKTGPLYCNEILVDTGGTFYMRVLNDESQTIAITGINITPTYSSYPLYIVDEPRLPLEVNGDEEFIISGRYETIETVRKGEGYDLLINVGLIHSPNRRQATNGLSKGRFAGSFGVLDDHPEPDECGKPPTSPLFYIFQFIMEQIQKLL